MFDEAGLTYEIPKNMLHTLWYKFMINVGINQASAVTRGQYKVFQTVDEARKLMESAMREVIRLSQKTGANLSEDDLKRWYEILYNVYPESRTSMLQDIEAGRNTEVEIFSGLICELGKKYGVATPVNQTLYYIIKTVEAIQSQSKKTSLA
ncbi:ketopantoate reductase C-terminal domain-containing protein [Terrilactibacillus sp. S3-3]|nr:ketopantoate reductase C-terminal domain-containing protein [Terrilactibacillus sp. S3-3]